MRKRTLTLLLAGLAVTSGPGHADDKLDGLDQTMQVLDDVSALQRTLAVLPPTDELRPSSGKGDAGNDGLSQSATPMKLDTRSGFAEDIIIAEDHLPFEDDFEEGEDVDDDRYDEP